MIYSQFTVNGKEIHRIRMHWPAWPIHIFAIELDQCSGKRRNANKKQWFLVLISTFYYHLFDKNNWRNEGEAFKNTFKNDQSIKWRRERCYQNWILKDYFTITPIPNQSSPFWEMLFIRLLFFYCFNFNWHKNDIIFGVSMILICVFFGTKLCPKDIFGVNYANLTKGNKKLWLWPDWLDGWPKPLNKHQNLGTKSANSFP